MPLTNPSVGPSVEPSELNFNLSLYGYFHGDWTIDGDGIFTNGGGMVGTLGRKEIIANIQTAAFAKVFDASEGVWRTLATSGTGAGYAVNFQCFPATEGIGDIVAFCGAVPFCELGFNVSGVVGAWSGDGAKWYFGDPAGTNALLAIVQDRTDEAAIGSGFRPFARDGALHFIPPSAWASATIGGQAGYWVWSQITATNMTTSAVLSDEHAIIVPVDGLTIPFDCYITAVRALTAVATLPTATDVKFILVNFTTGVVSQELTWVQDKATDSWTGITGTGVGSKLTCSTGDVIGILVTQEDGTNELSNVHMNFTLTPQ